MNTPSTIAVHQTQDINNIDTTDEKMPIVRFAPLSDFNDDLQQIHENGDLFGVYQDAKGNVAALDNQFTLHANILA